jgi:hypothetical protein
VQCDDYGLSTIPVAMDPQSIANARRYGYLHHVYVAAAVRRRFRGHRAEQWAEHRRQRDEEEWQCRVMVITEFDAGDPEATCTPLPMRS